MKTLGKLQSTDDEQWLQSYYLLRAAVAGVWVGAAFVFATNVPVLAAALLLIYPAWDAAANIVDARRHGGAKANPTQTLNAVVSILTTVAVGIALAVSMNAVLGVFGVWATLAGLFQLATAVRRWKSRGAQWAMILSGGQSMLVGVHVHQAGERSRDPRHRRHRALRRLWFVLLSDLGRLVGRLGCAPPAGAAHRRSYPRHQMNWRRTHHGG